MELCPAKSSIHKPRTTQVRGIQPSYLTTSSARYEREKRHAAKGTDNPPKKGYCRERSKSASPARAPSDVPTTKATDSSYDASGIVIFNVLACFLRAAPHF